MRVALKMTPVAEYTYWKGRASMKIFQISPATGGCHIRLGPAPAQRPEGLAYGRGGAGSQSHTDDIEKELGLARHPEGSLHVFTELSGCPDGSERDDENKIHL